MVIQLSCALKGDCSEIRRKGDDANLISTVKGSEYSGEVTDYDLCKIVGNADGLIRSLPIFHFEILLKLKLSSLTKVHPELCLFLALRDRICRLFLH